MNREDIQRELVAKVRIAQSELKKLSHEQRMERLDAETGRLETFLWDLREEIHTDGNFFEYSEAGLMSVLELMVVFTTLAKPLGDVLRMAREERAKEDGDEG
ncbi:MAG: hypothetical protein LUI09_01475 [Prevotellaceae bacterium]|nr:hypothetical protein [Prevotellaceae bacterium]